MVNSALLKVSQHHEHRNYTDGLHSVIISSGSFNLTKFCGMILRDMDDCAKTLLASFCNLGTVQKTGVVKVDLTSEQICPIELGFSNGVISCTGTEWHGNLVIAAFGPKFGSLWSSASEGYLHDISRGICIKSGIYHPHSLSARGKSFYWCESQRQLFWCLDGPIASLDGYVRGACWLSDQRVCLGTSVGRKQSKSTGLVGNPTDPGESTGSCVVSMIDIAAGRCEKRIDLTCVGREIYDLLEIED